MCKYQTKYINDKLKQLREKMKEVKDPNLALDMYDLYDDIKDAVNDKNISNT